MNNYYFKFTWKKQIFHKELEMEEYFKPYSYLVLSDLLQHTLFSEILGDNKNTDDNFNNLIRNIKRDSKYYNIVEKTLDSNIWTNNQEDPSSTSLFDYMSEIRLITQYYLLGQNNLEQIDNGLNNRSIELQNENIYTKLFLDYTKIMISIIVLLDSNSKYNSMEFLKFLRFIYSLNYKNSFLQKIIDGDKDAKLNLLNRIITSTNNKINIYSEFKLFKKLEIFLSEIEIKGLSTRKWRKDKGCYAIMTDNYNQLYFAFSGVSDYFKDENYNKMVELANKITSCFYNNSNQISSNWNISWSKLNNNVLCFSQNNILLSEPIILGSDNRINNWIKYKNDIGLDYGCCERKMISDANQTKQYSFFIKWAPCPKCIPAFNLFNSKPNIYYVYKDLYDFKKIHSQLMPQNRRNKFYKFFV